MLLFPCRPVFSISIAPLSPITAISSRLVDPSDGVMVRNCCRGSFAWTAFLARALVSWSDFVPLSILSPYFFDFSFFQESSSVLYSAGCHQVASCCDPGGGKPQGFRFLAVGSSISVGYAVLLGPSVIAVRFWLGFGRPRLLRSCSLNLWRCEIQLAFLDSV